eukprot:g12400.t1
MCSQPSFFRQPVAVPVSSFRPLSDSVPNNWFSSTYDSTRSGYSQVCQLDAGLDAKKDFFLSEAGAADCPFGSEEVDDVDVCNAAAGQLAVQEGKFARYGTIDGDQQW